jgi:alkylated DNA nucleotide flippase Atl1
MLTNFKPSFDIGMVGLPACGAGGAARLVGGPRSARPVGLLLRDQTFGPAVAIIRVADTAGAIRIAKNIQ